MHNVRTYNKLLLKKYYYNGYRMEVNQLPPWIYYTITEDENHKYLTVHSKIHKDREFSIGPKYTLEFSDRKIIKELSEKISKLFLNH